MGKQSALDSCIVLIAVLESLFGFQPLQVELLADG
jgi:hypothetical protein